ncbi:MarR family winged helix-turn-helix transcriptional regulator [Roseovarius sp. C7]|uniref:MarR family winged helix-turn-helix transcriptional regulator n=1 Tax=Roseovarius sp. C7 TaxID=3398643 RepID=UPI0039F6843B
MAYDRATIGGVIDRLERKGLLRREINPRDRRARILHLTPEGRQVIETLRPAVALVQGDILDGLSEAERDEFLAAMRRVLAL